MPSSSRNRRAAGAASCSDLYGPGHAQGSPHRNRIHQRPYRRQRHADWNCAPCNAKITSVVKRVERQELPITINNLRDV